LILIILSNIMIGLDNISGDQCLRTFAGFLEKEVQNRSGSLIRYGGEEFLVFLFGQDAEEAEETV